MTPERWQRLQALLQDALDRSPGERGSFLDEVCGGDEDLRLELGELLKSAEEAGTEFLSRPAAEAFSGAFEERRIGPYKLLREIGRGGMGSVYLGVRADEEYRKRVAVKLVRNGVDNERVLRRFRSERQILAGLDHPNIARLLDGGTTAEGVPYFVMEFIEGSPITQYCDERRLGIPERLKLFLDVLAAVQYAHQNLVVHRDLKPGNILVTSDAIPKLLDFGIAKLLNPDLAAQTIDPTETVLRLMTPEYASPEQVRGGKITTATDIYGLGVILYELLTGHRPYRVKTRQPLELLQVVCERDPDSPSTAVRRIEVVPGEDGALRITPEMVSAARGAPPERLYRTLKGDLDSLVLKGMWKGPERRYSSAERFAEDIRRYLDGLPVLACGGDLRYRAGKFVRRHGRAVLAAGLVAASLAAGMLATLREARIADSERARAERRYADVRGLAESMLFELHDLIEPLPGSTRARAVLVQRGLKYLDQLASEAAGDRSLQLQLAAAYSKVGELQWNRYYANLGDRAGAIQSQQRALKIREQIAAAEPRNARAMAGVAASHFLLGDLSADLKVALDHYRKALAIRKDLSASTPNDRDMRRLVANTHQRIGDTLGNPFFRNLGDWAGALENFTAMQSIYEALAREEPSLRNRHSVAVGYEKLAKALIGTGNWKAAVDLFRKELAGFEADAKADPNNAQFRRDLSIAYGNIGDALLHLGDAAGAIRHMEQARDRRELLLAADPDNAGAQNDVINALDVLSKAYAGSGRKQDARLATARLLELRKNLADRPGATADDVNDYAWALVSARAPELRDPGAALVYARRALQLRDPPSAEMLDTLAWAYNLSGDRTRAVETEKRALELLPEDSNRRKEMEANLARFLGAGTAATLAREAR